MNSRPKHRAFTLIELLTVVAIISLLLALAIPIVTNKPTAARITGDADTLVSQLNHARTLAIADGQATEMRFYLTALPGLPGREKQFRSYQLLSYHPERKIFLPEGRMEDFQGDNMIVNNPIYSSLTSSSKIKSPDPNADAAGNTKAKDLSFFSVHFNPDGSTTLPKGGDTWFLSIVDFHENQNAAASEQPAANFVTLQIDPYNGSIRRYEPSL